MAKNDKKNTKASIINLKTIKKQKALNLKK